MKTALFVLLFVFCYVECRKIYTPIDKNANLDFINMEAGGLGGRVTKPGSPTVAPVAKPVPVQPAQPAPVQPAKPAQVQPAVKPTPVQPAPAQPSPVQPAKPVQPTPVKPVPVYPTPAANPITTPGPGSVKSLVNFYDSQGKASVIRPYSYSQAVKQG